MGRVKMEKLGKINRKIKKEKNLEECWWHKLKLQRVWIKIKEKLRGIEILSRTVKRNYDILYLSIIIMR